MTELGKFIKKVMKAGEFEGCWFYCLGDGLSLVFAYDDDLKCKLAYNNSSLQCDYDFDWAEPTNEDGDLIGFEYIQINGCGYTWKHIEIQTNRAKDFVLKCGWKKPEYNEYNYKNIFTNDLICDII